MLKKSCLMVGLCCSNIMIWTLSLPKQISWKSQHNWEDDHIVESVRKALSMEMLHTKGLCHGAYWFRAYIQAIFNKTQRFDNFKIREIHYFCADLMIWHSLFLWGEYSLDGNFILIIFLDVNFVFLFLVYVICLLLMEMF